MNIKNQIRNEMLESLQKDLFEACYPKCVDKEFGGYFTNFSHDWQIEAVQEKMIVTQARHMWTAAKAAKFFGNKIYENATVHGLKFLKDKQWDNDNGGFFQVRDRDGGFTPLHGWRDEKRAYGNAFGVYGLSALYELTKNPEVIAFARTAFEWIEEHCYDPHYGGYFQFITKEGNIFGKNDEYKTLAKDENEVGFKDQNSSIHLMEAYTELYTNWKDEILYKKLRDILVLIRDTMTSSKGYLRLFFEPDFKPVSFRDDSKEVREKNFGLDHVSFGHDYETAFLMMEASHILGIENDTRTLAVAKKMLDHAIDNGWDKEGIGFVDEGYYFAGEDKCKIIKDSKTWWVQAEGLNALLMFSKIYPEEKRYFEMFVQLWDYVKKNLIDHEHGGWYWGGLDKQPFYKTGSKQNLWQCTYHNGRALMNCISMLADEDFELYGKSEGFREKKKQTDEFIEHWKKVRG
ncbi:MAG: AGE family epimerase/isomerase [bacterium]